MPTRDFVWRRAAGPLAGGTFLGLGAAALVALSSIPAMAASAAPVASVYGSSTPVAKLPAPPADGVMGFVVDEFHPPVVFEAGACPDGPVERMRYEYLHTLPAAEQARLQLKENEKEWTQRFYAWALGPNRTNVCTNPDMFDRSPMRTVQSKTSWGLSLDDGKGDTCTHEKFIDPEGRKNIDNQEYRVKGCTLEWRGVDGISNDVTVGERQFIVSGEWTQVILLRGVHSLVHDDNVEVVLANTIDPPPVDSKGQFLRGASFKISDVPPRHRNVLHGRIENGVLTTEPTDISLDETWGQGAPRDLRGVRTAFHYIRGRLRLAFQADGSIQGLLGGYRPVNDTIVSEELGGIGSAVVAGIDCAQELVTLKKYADGVRDPKTGKCTAVSSAMQIGAIPAYVTDIDHNQKAAEK
jgi:hypothetical protein